MRTNLEKRLTKAETILGLGKTPRVYICRVLDSGKEIWKDFTGIIKKPKTFNPADRVIRDNIGAMRAKNNNSTL